MKKPLQSILMAPGFETQILEGRKIATICKDHRDYEEGPCILCCPWSGFVVQVQITKCLLTNFANLLDKHFVNSGMEPGTSHEMQIEIYREFYPDLSWDSCVTYVEWSQMRGIQAGEFPEDISVLSASRMLITRMAQTLMLDEEATLS